MKSVSKRTYSRKRKDTAEDKFDALFSSHSSSDVVTVEVKRVRTGATTFDDSPVVDFKSSKKIHNQTSKFDLNGSGNTKPSQSPFLSPSGLSLVEKSDSKGLYLKTSNLNSKFDEHSTVMNTNGTLTGSAGQFLTKPATKYDVLFQRNEKTASDKFDALFGDGNSTTHTTLNAKPTTDAKNIPSGNVKKNEYQDLFGFESPTKQAKVTDSIELVGTVRSKPLTKSPIKAATMKTVAGHVVLNIHRGVSPKNDCKIPVTTSKPPQNPSAKVTATFNTSKGDKTSSRLKFGSSENTNAQSVLDKSNSTKVSYNSRPWHDSSQESNMSPSPLSSSQPPSQSSSEEFVPAKLTRSITMPENIGESIVTSIKCNKQAKACFTVVKHVKNYQNCVVEGEAQEFADEVDYLLEGLQSSQPTSVRCLSVMNLASKCQQPSFRLYLRAHNVPKKIFSHLTDANGNKSLSLSTAALLFMLSRDRRMEIDKSTLQLVLSLLDPLDREANNQGNEKQVEGNKSFTKYKFLKSRDKAAQLDENEKNLKVVEGKILEMIESCPDALINENVVSVKRLASEALIRFTARQTPEWYREEVRLKGGLDHIISLVKHQVESLSEMSGSASATGSFPHERPLCMLERLLKVLENTVVNSPRNSMYLVTHLRALLLKKLSQLLQFVQEMLSKHPVETDKTSSLNEALYNTMLQAIKLIVNISNDNEWVSTRVGEQDGLLECVITAVLFTPNFVKEASRYELILLALSLLVNLVESSAKNRIVLMKMNVPSLESKSESKSVVEALVQLFVDREVAARSNEVLGEEGVKKAVNRAKECDIPDKSSDSESVSGSQSSVDDRLKNVEGGHWVESEDGMEWIPSTTEEEESLPLSQRSSSSGMRNPEASLSVEQKAEMKQMLDKANEHMEHSVVAAYAGLVLGCLIHANRANIAVIRSYFGDDASFAPMIRILRKFLSFMNLTAGMSAKGERLLTQIIEDLQEESAALS